MTSEARVAFALVIVSLLLTPSPAATELPAGPHWPSFRGQFARGVAPGPTPVLWDVKSRQNIAWMTTIPGLGHSSPTVWGDRIFLTTAVAASGPARVKTGYYGDIEPVEGDGPHEWRVLCIHREDGRIVWQKSVHSGVPRTKRHPKSSHANPTCATDGRVVVSYFGSEGLYCHDLDGNLQWRKDLGVLDAGYFRSPAAQWGVATSPIVHDGRVILQCDVQGGGFLAAFDLKDGSEIWRTPRNDVPTWSTPTVDIQPGRTQILVNGYRHIGGYDIEDGSELWRMRGTGDIPVPTPIVAHGLAFITNAHGGLPPVYAVRTEAEGRLTAQEQGSEHIAWHKKRGGNYMQTPIVVGDLLFLCSDTGVFSCYDARTGKVHYRQRLPVKGTFTASPVSGGGHIYFTAETGEVVVMKAAPRFEIAGTNELGESCLATPSIAGQTLYFRTRHHLVAVQE